MATLDKKSDNSSVYKVGKSWIFVSLISAGVLFTLSNSVAYADTTVDSPVATEDINTPKISQPQSPTTPHKPDNLETPEDTAPKEPSPDTNNHDNLELPSEEAPKKSSSVHTATMALPPSKPTGRSSLASPTPEKTQPVVSTLPATLPAPVTSVAPKPQTQVAPSQSINDWMPNTTLQKMVADALGISVSDLSPQAMTKLTTLTSQHKVGSTTFVDGQTPFSLKGLEWAINLTTLDLSYGNTKGKDDYTNLEYSPNGSGNSGDIIDISPLNCLQNLITLDLSGNKIHDLTPLAQLKKLKTLDVTNNRIADFSMLDANQITSLKIRKQIVIVDYAQRQFVNLATHAITVALPIHLPKNSKSKIIMPFAIEDGFEKKEIMLQEFHLGTNSGKSIFQLYYSGEPSDGFQLSDDGSSIAFNSISSQITYHFGGTYGGYPFSMGLPTPGNHRFYLRANLRCSTGGSFIVFIPYSNATAAASITIHYRNGQDNSTSIKPDLTLGPGKITGDTYTLTPDQLAVPGYAYDTERNKNTSTTITFTDQAQTITLYYKKDTTKPITPPVTPTSTVTVTVHYQDEQGRQLLTNTKLTGQPGTSYHVTTPTLTGYQLTSASNPTGTFGNHDQTIIVTYHQLSTSGGGDTSSTSETPTDSSQPDTIKPVKPQQALPTSGNGAATISVANKHPQRPATAPKNPKPMTLTEQSQPVLPQTSEHRTSPLIGLGLLLASLIGITARFRKRN